MTNGMPTPQNMLGPRVTHISGRHLNPYHHHPRRCGANATAPLLALLPSRTSPPAHQPSFRGQIPGPSANPSLPTTPKVVPPNDSDSPGTFTPPIMHPALSSRPRPVPSGVEFYVLPAAKLDYNLPESLIATQPAEPRDSARLMVLRRSDPTFVQHCLIRDLPQWLAAGDLLIVNSSKVIPACLSGIRVDTGGKVEGLFLGVESADEAIKLQHNTTVATAAPHGYIQHGCERWRIMLKGRRMRPGIFVGLTDALGKPAGVSLKLIERTSADAIPRTERALNASTPERHAPDGSPAAAQDSENDAWLVEVFACGVEAGMHKRGELPVALLERIGTTPLPPYIKAARRRDDGTFGQHGGQSDADAATSRTELALRDEHDRHRYQTVYADSSAAGSVAAPTAGLHFTPELLATLAQAGIRREQVVLHVGTGTFKPIEVEFVEHHPMHAEWCHIPQAAGQAINITQSQGGRIIAVGTTSARTLESFGRDTITSGAKGWTRLLITPGWKYQHLDGLLTNFHLPRSTLLAMVAALLPEGIDRLLQHYQDAINRGYRFYSYGDAMLILP